MYFGNSESRETNSEGTDSRVPHSHVALLATFKWRF